MPTPAESRVTGRVSGRRSDLPSTRTPDKVYRQHCKRKDNALPQTLPEQVCARFPKFL